VLKKNRLIFVAVNFFLMFTPGFLYSVGVRDVKEQKKSTVEIVSLYSHVGAYKELLEQEVERFNNTIGKEQNIKIEMETQIDKYPEKLILYINSGNFPDLFTMIPEMEATFVENRWIQPLEEVPGVEGLLERFKPYLRNNVHIFGGETYALPLELLPIKIAYNKDLFRKAGIVDSMGSPTPPETWDDVIEYSKRITEVGDGKAFGWGITFAWHSFFWRRMVFMPWIASLGHSWFDHRTGEYNFSDFKPAVEFILRIKEDRSYFPGPEFIDIDPIRVQFSEGRIGMLISPSYDIGVFNDQFPSRIDWDICDLPVMNPESRYKEVMLDRTNVSIGSKVSGDRMLAVVEVFKFLHSKEHYAFLYSNNKIIPHEQEVIDMVDDIQNKTGWAIMSDISDCYPILPTPGALITVEGADYNEVLDMVWAGGLGVDVALADLDKRYNNALERAVLEGKVKLEDYISDEILKLQ